MSGEHQIERWTDSQPPDGDVLRKRMMREGYSVFEWSDQPGTSYGVHKHSTHQSHWIISGTLELIIDGARTVILGPGDRDFMPSNTVHSARVLGDEPVVYLIGEKR